MLRRIVSRCAQRWFGNAEQALRQTQSTPLGSLVASVLSKSPPARKRNRAFEGRQRRSIGAVIQELEPRRMLSQIGVVTLQHQLPQLLDNIDSQAIESTLFKHSLPMIGSGLANVPLVQLGSLIKTQIAGPSSHFENLAVSASASDLANALTADIADLVASQSNPGLGLTLTATPTADKSGLILDFEESVTAHVGLNLGLPGLNFNIDANTAIKLGISTSLKFTVATPTSESFSFTPDAKFLTVHVDAGFDSSTSLLTGKIGVLNTTISDKGSHLTGTFQITASPSTSDSISGIQGTFTTSKSVVDVLLSASVLSPGSSPSDDIPNLSLDAELISSWPFSKSSTDSSNATFGSTPSTTITVSIDSGTLMSSFLAPVFAQAKSILGPLVTIANGLEQHPFKGIGIPGFEDVTWLQLLEVTTTVASSGVPSDLAGLINLVVNSQQGTGRWAFFDSLVKFTSLAGLASSDISTHAVIQVGKFVVPDGRMPGKATISSSSPNLNFANSIRASDAAGFFGAAASVAGSTNSSSTAGKVNFDFVQHPEQFFQLFINGNPVKLLSVQFPTLTAIAKAGYNYNTTVGFIPVTLGINGGVQADASFAFGYDTLGIQEYAQTADSAKLLDGFTFPANQSILSIHGIQSILNPDGDLLNASGGIGFRESLSGFLLQLGCSPWFIGLISEFIDAEFNLSITGGPRLQGDIDISLNNPDNKTTLRLSDLGGSLDNLLNVSGQVASSASIVATAEVSGHIDFGWGEFAYTINYHFGHSETLYDSPSAVLFSFGQSTSHQSNRDYFTGAFPQTNATNPRLTDLVVYSAPGVTMTIQKSDSNSPVEVLRNGQSIGTYAPTGNIIFNTNGGGAVVDFGHGDPLTAGGLTVIGSGGPLESLVFSGAGQISSAIYRPMDDSDVDVAGMTLKYGSQTEKVTINHFNHSSGVRVDNFGSVTVTPPESASSTLIQDGGSGVNKVKTLIGAPMPTGSIGTNVGSTLLPLAISNCQSVSIDLQNETATSGTQVVFESPLVIADLQTFTVVSGNGYSGVTADAPGISLPNGGSIDLILGKGSTSVDLRADADIQLSNSGISTNQGTNIGFKNAASRSMLPFVSISTVNPDSGNSSRLVTINEWDGVAKVTGGASSTHLVNVMKSNGAGNVSAGLATDGSGGPSGGTMDVEVRTNDAAGTFNVAAGSVTFGTASLQYSSDVAEIQALTVVGAGNVKASLLSAFAKTTLDFRRTISSSQPFSVTYNATSLPTTATFEANTVLTTARGITLSDGVISLRDNARLLVSGLQAITGTGSLDVGEGVDVLSGMSASIDGLATGASLTVTAGIAANLNDGTIGEHSNLKLVNQGTINSVAGKNSIGSATTNTGLIHLSGDLTFDGALTNSSRVVADPDATLDFIKNVLNGGSIVVATTLILRGGVTFQTNGVISVSGMVLLKGSQTIDGPGKLQLTDQSASVESDDSAGAVTLTLGASGRIEGAGLVGVLSGLQLVVAGTVSANLAGYKLTLNHLTDNGIVTAESGGTLDVTNQTVNGTGVIGTMTTGTLIADGSVYNVDVDNQGSFIANVVWNSLTELTRKVTNGVRATFSIRDSNAGYPFAVGLTIDHGFTNDGTIQISQPGQDGGARTTFKVLEGTLKNSATGLISIEVQHFSSARIISIYAYLENNGVVQIEAPTAWWGNIANANTFNVDRSFDLSYQFPVLERAEFNNSGRLNFAAGSTSSFELNHFTNSGTIQGKGTLDLTGTTVTLNSPFTLDQTTPQFQINQTTFNGDATLTVAPGTTLAVEGANFFNPVVNRGKILVGYQHYYHRTLFDRMFSNAAGATLQIATGPNNEPVTFSQGATNAGLIDLKIGSSNFVWSITSPILTNESTGVIIAEGPNDGSVTTQFTGPSANQGMTLLNQGTITIAFPIDLAGTLVNQGTINVTVPQADSVLGATIQPATSTFANLGTVNFTGSGTSSHPQLLEVLSSDVGASPSAFANNSVFEKLSLSRNTYLKLVNQTRNRPDGPQSEAVYALALNVPSGTTLDLNHLHLYASVVSIQGNVINGTVTTVPTFQSAASATFRAGVQNSFVVTSIGVPAMQLSVSGTLPTGVTFNPATGTLSGTPAVNTGKQYALTFAAKDGAYTAKQLFTLTVNEAVAISSVDHAAFVVGKAGSFKLTAIGFPAPTLSLTGKLPTGITFDANTGILSGTPAAGTSGAYPLTFKASNGLGSNATQAFTLAVNQPSAITSVNHATFVVGTVGTFHFTTTGFPVPALTITGKLPTGVTFDSRAGTLSGTPAAGTGGAYPVTFTATNGVGANATQAFTLTINQAPAISSVNHVTFTVGSIGTFKVTATGFPVAVLSFTGKLPTGVTFEARTGTLSGTPAAGTGGTYPVTFTAANGVGTKSTQVFTLTINQAPAISSVNHATFTVGTAGTFKVTATGFPVAALSVTGKLPTGVTFDARTGTLSGTPAAGTGGTYPVTFTAANGVGTKATQVFTLTINQAPSISSVNHVTFTVGTAGTFKVTATGFPAAVLSVTGKLPTGVTFDARTGTLSGTPAAGTGGTYPVTFSATNGVGTKATQVFTLTINQAPAISSVNHATFAVGTAGTFKVTATGLPVAVLSVTGKLPTGVTFDARTGTLSGTPAVGTGGNYPVTFSATNGVGTKATQVFTLTINQAPAISSVKQATFKVGTVGTFIVTVTGFPAPVLSVSGTLPTGITFDPRTGKLSGKPASSVIGTYHLTFTAKNGVGSNATQAFTLTVKL